MRIELDCEHCEEWLTVNYTGACRDHSSNCCGGCDVTETCSECNGSGVEDVDVYEYFGDELSGISEHLKTMYDDMTHRGVSKSEAKKLISKLTTKIINEQK